MAIDTKPLNHPEAFEALCKDALSRVKEVSCDDVEAMMANGEEFLLIDVRDRDEFDAFRIHGATFLSKGWIEAKIHTVAEDKAQKLVLYCGGGNRSALAADNLQRMGYDNVLSMAGGIKAWANSGKAVEED